MVRCIIINYKYNFICYRYFNDSSSNNKKNARGDDGGTIAKLEEKLKDDDARQ